MIQKDWIFICGMMRSGSTMLHSLISLFVKAYGGTAMHYAFASEGKFPIIAAKAGDKPTPRLIKAHGYDENIRHLFETGRAAGVYSYRDLHAALVSMGRWEWKRHERPLDDPAWMHQFCEAQLEHQRFWTQWPDVLIIPYPQIRHELPRVITAVTEFIGVDVSEGSALALAKRYGMDAMRERLGNDHVHDGADAWRQYVTEDQADLIASVVAQYPQGLML